jgi:predicted DNA-binding transcriptional regulator AlpA
MKRKLKLASDLRERKQALRAAEVADLLQVSRECVYQYARLGILPSIKISDVLRFDSGELADYLERIISND